MATDGAPASTNAPVYPLGRRRGYVQATAFLGWTSLCMGDESNSNKDDVKTQSAQAPFPVYFIRIRNRMATNWQFRQQPLRNTPIHDDFVRSRDKAQ